MKKFFKHSQYTLRFVSVNALVQANVRWLTIYMYNMYNWIIWDIYLVFKAKLCRSNDALYEKNKINKLIYWPTNRMMVTTFASLCEIQLIWLFGTLSNTFSVEKVVCENLASLLIIWYENRFKCVWFLQSSMWIFLRKLT